MNLDKYSTKNIFFSDETLKALSEIGVFITNFITGESYTSWVWKNFPEKFKVGMDSLSYLEYVHPDDRERLKENIGKAHNGEVSVFEDTYRILDKEGKYCWIKSIGKVVSYTENGKPFLFIGADSNITKIKEIEYKLRLSIEQEKCKSSEFELLRQIAATVSSTLDLEQTINHILQETKKIIPYDTASVQLLEGNKLQVIGCEGFKDSESVMKLCFDFPQQESLSTQAISEQKPILSNDVTVDFPGFIQPEDGMLIHSWIGIPLINQGNAIGFMALDSFERNKYNSHHLRLASTVGIHIAMALENSLLHEKAYNMAMADALTGAGSRHRFQIEGRLFFETAKREETELSLAIFDIDHFKSVNDEFGHDIGDKVLKRIASVCSETVRNIDLFARIGGEEFSIIMSKTSANAAFKAMERIREKVKAIEHPELNRPVTISIGIYSAVPSHNGDFNSFTCNADKALYHSKETGRNKTTSNV